MGNDAQRMAEKRARERDLRIPRVKEPNRRRDCLADPYLFLPTYFERVFYQPFTDDRREMLNAILHAARFGGDQAEAGPRGDGKTRMALFGALFLELSCLLFFPLIISKSGPRAHRELRNLKDAIRDSEKLHEDFPEVCVPILDACRWPSKARMQTAFGTFTDLEWSEESIVFPTLPTELLRANGWNEDIESAAIGQITASLGIEGPIRGYSIRNKRPDLAILDDIDDRESARSDLQTETREQIIEEDVGGLAGPDQTIPRVMLCTLINRKCTAATYTDQTKKPSWNGHRHKLLAAKPTNEALWEQYIDLRKGKEESDRDARVAHQFYLDNRESMDEGAVCTNQYRFNKKLLLDGSPAEVSALQHCYNIIADRGWDHFATEYQNDPPEEAGPQESGISESLIISRVHGYPQSTVPPAARIAQAWDIGDHRCHWSTVAADANAAYYVIDYGFDDVHGTSPEDMASELRQLAQDDPRKKLAIEQAIFKTLVSMRNRLLQEPYCNEGGEIIEPSMVLLDSGSGLHRNVIYQFCRDFGAPFYPAKGFGQGRGKFRSRQASPKVRLGENWAKVRQDDAGFRDIWLHEFDSDYWKRFVHARWMTPTLDDNGHYAKGGMSLWRHPQSHRHSKFARQQASEVWITEFVPGKGEKQYFDKRGANHWLDATAMCCVGLSMAGTRVVGEVRKRSVRSMSEMQQAAKGA